MTLPVECLMAITGIFPKGGHPSVNDQLAAAGILESYRVRLKRWLRSYDDETAARREFDAPEPPEEKALQDRILDPMEDDDVARIMAEFSDPVDADAYLDLIQSARAYVDSQWPRLPVPGISADVFPLSQEELADIWTIVRVLDNPDVLFEELEAESLTIPMVDAWRSVYPEMAAATDRMFDELVIERIAARKSLTWQQSDLYRMIRGIPLDAIVEVKQDQPKANASAQQQRKTGEST